MAKILLVEDDKLMMKLYVGKLQDEGFKVFTAEDGLKGLELAKIEKPDLILLDILMPGLRGDSVLEKIKSDSELKSIPVIMLTNLDDKEILTKLIGADDYLVKAKTDPSEVIDIINNKLKKE